MTITVPTPRQWLDIFTADGEIDQNDLRGVLWTLLYSDSSNVKDFRKLCGYFCKNVPDTIEGIREKARTELLERFKKRGILTDEITEMYLDPGTYDIELQSAHV